MKKITITKLNIALIMVIGLLLVTIVVNYVKQTNLSSNRRSNNINNLIKELKPYRIYSKTTSNNITKTNNRSKESQKNSNDLEMTRRERNHYLGILRKKEKTYSNHNYNSLENRLQARINNNKAKKIKNMSNKINNLLSAQKTLPSTLPSTLPPTLPPTLTAVPF